jgi:hypothetical protein
MYHPGSVHGYRRITKSQIFVFSRLNICNHIRVIHIKLYSGMKIPILIETCRAYLTDVVWFDTLLSTAGAYLRMKHSGCDFLYPVLLF